MNPAITAANRMKPESCALSGASPRTLLGRSSSGERLDLSVARTARPDSRTATSRVDPSARISPYSRGTAGSSLQGTANSNPQDQRTLSEGDAATAERIVRGYVGLDGEALGGRAFSIERGGAGKYRVLFDTPFASRGGFPIVVITPRNFLGTRSAAAVTRLGFDEFEIEVFDARTGEPRDDGFCFMAVGEA